MSSGAVRTRLRRKHGGAVRRGPRLARATLESLVPRSGIERQRAAESGSHADLHFAESCPEGCRRVVALFRRTVSRADNKGWSLYGAPWLQPVATGSKCASPENGSNKPKPSPPVATSCRSERMVSRASAVGCHQLREVPLLANEGVDAYLARLCAPISS